MEKPKLKNKSSYDWNKAVEYIEKKYNIDIRDYAGKFKNGKMRDVKYLDFWHFMIDMFDIHNGCFITLSDDYIIDNEKIEPWQKEINDIFLDEFGGKNREATFWVSW